MGVPDFTKRSRILGLPIGPRRTNWDEVVRTAGIAVATVGAGALARKLVRGKGRVVTRRASSVMHTVRRTLADATGGIPGLRSAKSAVPGVGQDDGAGHDADESRSGGGDDEVASHAVVTGVDGKDGDQADEPAGTGDDAGSRDAEHTGGYESHVDDRDAPDDVVGLHDEDASEDVDEHVEQPTRAGDGDDESTIEDGSPADDERLR